MSETNVRNGFVPAPNRSLSVRYKIILSPVKMMLAKMSRAALRGEAVKGALDSFIMTAGCPRPVMRVKVSHIHDFTFLGHS